jgi:hypothetical protein
VPACRGGGRCSASSAWGTLTTAKASPGCRRMYFREFLFSTTGAPLAVDYRKNNGNYCWISVRLLHQIWLRPGPEGRHSEAQATERPQRRSWWERLFGTGREIP